MTLTWAAAGVTSAAKDKVAGRLFNTTYTLLGSGWQQNEIDGQGASALLELQMIGQYFSLAGGTASAPDSFEPALIALAAYKVSLGSHPDTRSPLFLRDYNRTLLSCASSFNRQNTDYDPAAGATAEAFIYTLLSVRNYVFSTCVRLPTRGGELFVPDVQTVDAAFDEVVKSLWNRAGYRFRRRPATMTITRVDFTGGTYTDSTKTISGLTGVGTGLDAGTRLYLTVGTNANLGEYTIASTTATTIVLSSSAGAAANGSTDLVGFYVTVSYGGLEANEVFDSFSTVKWAYMDTSHEWDRMAWLDGDMFQEARAIEGTGALTSYGRPRWFRTHAIGSTSAYQFSPPPDTTYRLRGEVLVVDPSSPVLAGGTTATASPFTKFAAEWGATIRRKILDQVKVTYGRGDDRLSDSVSEEVESRFSDSAGAGAPEQRGGVTDVYQDHQFRREFGGPMSFGGTL